MFVCRRNKKLSILYSLVWKLIKIKMDFLTKIVYLKKGKKFFEAEFDGHLVILNTQRKSPAEIGLKFEVRNKEQILKYFSVYPGLDCKFTPKMFGGDEIIVYKNNNIIKKINKNENLDYLTFIKTIKER